MLREGQKSIFIVGVLLLAIFTPIFFIAKNYEFVAYVGVVLAVGILIFYTNRKVNYPNGLLWGLLSWAGLHLAGGGIIVGDGVLYRLILLPLSEEYGIFRYDQFVHIWGFAVATYLAYVILLPSLVDGPRRWVSLGIVIVMAGLGFGAVNEIIEFSATVFFDETGVGGYVNTSLDLVSDLVGALIALVLIRKNERKNRI